ncbi:ribosomal large subunit pseudouridine synthase B [Compostibacillus humi]|uniref:Pseudouridine synthase n=1 Tax=Compostibacillus humi TaxID=1245525 RepID=A0A8J2ZNX0_9BACI|nr:pseudouridine synthase [Compostibacillus humi]GGH69012.1 ribosomal large subunit pseudouridine synthase B [Compostibacillus humi]HLT55959.1 pseudouridine synthase [Bacillota bacterium]
MENNLERLQKVIAQSGIASRRKAEQLILEGKVKVNGKVITTLGTKVSKEDRIEVNGIPVEKEQPVYYVMYKPRGVISSVKDDRNRKTVIDLFGEEVTERIFPIGRLDYDTSGLLLLTNDGEFANLIMHPKYKIDKVYIAKVKGIPTKQDLSLLKKGVRSGKDFLKAVHVKLKGINRKSNTAILEITLHEGKNRHIRRMMDELGFPVLKLKRERYGFLDLKGLNPGEYRPLNPKEVKQLRHLAIKNVK